MQMKAYFDQTRIGRKEVPTYAVGDQVWINIRRQIPNIKLGRVKWIGPCEIVGMTPGPLYTLRHDLGDVPITYDRTHPQHMKPFNGKTT